MPFLHGSLSHLIANTSGLAVLLPLSLTYSRRQTLFACLIIILLGGGLVWVFGTLHTIHIGASGLIFGLIGFLLFQTIFDRNWRSLLISLLVGGLYGGVLLSLLVAEPGISWAAHFWGFTAGVAAAWSLRKKKK